MKFKHSVIGDNTQENREWLEKVGYKSIRFFQGKKYLYATTGQRANAKEVWNEPYYGTVDDVDFYVSCGFIPILGNSPLFKAVTAISITTDIGKYYINNHTGQWRKCDYNMATDENIDWNDWTEATLTELQERFKEKER